MKVVICLDFSSYTERVLQAAKSLVGDRVPQPEITVLHVIDTSVLSGSAGNDQETIKQNQLESQQLLAMAKEYLGSGFSYQEEYGVPSIKLDEVLAQTDYDLLVVGTRGRSMLASAFLGSVAEHLLHRSNRPVMIVP